MWPQVAATNTDLLTHFSPSLQAELAWRANRRWVQRVPFLVGTELRFMVQLALALRPAVYAPGERPGAGWMYVIHRGIALYGGRMLTSGKVQIRPPAKHWPSTGHAPHPRTHGARGHAYTDIH